MTVEEAKLIEEQVASGAIDPQLPGTMDVVNEAHRTGVNAYMWGSAGGSPQRRGKRRLIAATCGIVALTIAGLVLSFLAAR
jgi:hypothetical protein